MWPTGASKVSLIARGLVQRWTFKNDVPGATSPSLTLSQSNVSQSGNLYRAVFTNTCSGTQTATTAPAESVNTRRLDLIALSSKSLPLPGRQSCSSRRRHREHDEPENIRAGIPFASVCLIEGALAACRTQANARQT